VFEARDTAIERRCIAAMVRTKTFKEEHPFGAWRWGGAWGLAALAGLRGASQRLDMVLCMPARDERCVSRVWGPCR
jgi:hypothetical protein